MRHILDTPGSLTVRGQRFLAARARTDAFPLRRNPDDSEVVARLASFPTADTATALARSGGGSPTDSGFTCGARSPNSSSRNGW